MASSTKMKKNTKKTKEEIEENRINDSKIIGRIIYERKDEDKSLVDIYFDLQLEFMEKYGENTVVLMQVGSFFECYGVDNEQEKIGDLVKIAELLNIQLSRRNKSILENSRSNAQMCGFPCASFQRFLNVLLTSNYTVVLIEQTSPPPNPKREITAVHSIATYIDDIQTSDPNHIVSIYMDEVPNYKIPGSNNYVVGLSSIDLATGYCSVYQSNNHLYDKKAVFEDIYRFIESYNPREIIYHEGKLQTITKDELIQVMNLTNRIGHFDKTEVPTKITQIHYQNEFLKKIYPDHGMYSPIEYLGLEKYPDAILSFLLLLEFSYEHNENILRKIKKPELWEYHEHLILYHNTIYQLNIIPLQNQYDNSSKYKSLFDVIQKTSTSMGRRLLKYRLMNPITSCEELEKRYQLIENMIESGTTDEIEKMLNGIMDIERMHRKMDMGNLHPHEFGSLDTTYEKIIQLIDFLREKMSLEEYKMNEDLVERFKEYREDYLQTFDIDEMLKYGLLNIQTSFFKKGIFQDLDTLQKKVEEIEKFWKTETQYLSNLLEPGSDTVKCENTDKDGYFFTCTKKRGEVLTKKLQEMKIEKYQVLKHNMNSMKIMSKEIEENSKNLILSIEKIKSIAKEKYQECIQKWVNQYDSVLKEMSTFIAQIDIVKSCSKTSILNGYHRPKIVDTYDGRSYFKTKQMRHPLIELIHEKVIYVDNDLELLKEKEECLGILLMGLNGVGKSSMAKAIGCNIVMAQMGMFVACKEFEYYPYTKIFTRINGEDNIFKGMSSFVVEMNELRSILKYADERSIVLGDEVCKGTEETSALSIVSSTIQRFSERDVNFVMATHFHKLHEMEEIQELKNVRFKHLSVQYDRESDRIIYGRKLMDGPGDTLYGLEIAQFLIKDEDFIKKARRIRDKLICQSEKIIEEKRSNYHKELIMDCCMICKKNGLETVLHTHHLKEQSEFEEEGVMNIDGVRKNQLGNLVVLCEEHHEETHHGRLKIEGWIEGTMGRTLKWYYEEEKEEEKEEEEEEDPKLKWIEEEIEKMKKMGIEKKNMKKNIQQRLKKKGWEISLKTLQMYMDKKKEKEVSDSEEENILVV